MLIHMSMRSIRVNFTEFYFILACSLFSGACDLRFYKIIYCFQVEMILQALEYEKGMDLYSNNEPVVIFPNFVCYAIHSTIA